MADDLSEKYEDKINELFVKQNQYDVDFYLFTSFFKTSSVFYTADKGQNPSCSVYFGVRKHFYSILDLVVYLMIR